MSMLAGVLMSKRRSSGYRYIRLYITANNGDPDYTSLQEIELATTAGGADITTPSSPTSQDGYYGGNSFAYAVDNNQTEGTAGCFVTDGTALPHWGYVDLGSAKVCVELRMWCQYYSGLESRAPKNFQIQGSNNKTSWTTIKSFTNATGWVTGTVKTFSLV